MRRSLTWACVVWFVLSACGRPDVRGADASSPGLRVVTWNVHDLFDEVDRTVPPGEWDLVPTPEQVEEKLSRLATVLARIDADLVLLQEVENLDILERLAATPPLAGRYPEARLVEGFDPRGIDVAALARMPIERYVSHLGERDAAGAPLWSRDCVEVHLRAGGRPAIFLLNHFISQLAGDDLRRTEQAAAARAIADGLADRFPDALVAIAGDLNDEPDSAPLAPLLSDGVYTDPGASLDPSIAWTYGGAFHSRLDYVLVHRRSAAALERFEVIAGDDVALASDHRPVVADFWLP